MLTGRIPVFPRGGSCLDPRGEGIFVPDGPRRRPMGFAFTVSDLEPRTMLSVVTGVVSDINHTPAGVTNLTGSGGKLFFVTQDSTPGTASLWANGGTSQGSVELSTIESSSYGLPTNSPPFVALNGSVYFMSTDSSGGQGLFKTDGTAAGTAEVAPLAYLGGDLMAAGGKIYFTENAPSGLELWASDGTANGTSEVTSFGPQSNVYGTTVAPGGSVYFAVETNAGFGPGSTELWTSDGTPGGTVQLTDFSAGSSLSSLTVLGGKLVFIGNDGTDGDELWTTDGTPTGTTALTDFSGLQIQGSSGCKIRCKSRTGTLYFDAYDPTTNSYQIWASDGTSSGTVPVTATGGTYSFAGDFTAVGNTVYFVGAVASETSATGSMQLWAINGGTAAPVTPNTSWVSGPAALTALNDSTLLFAADDGSGHGEELWESDGTASGTTMVKDINPGPAGSISYSNAYTVPSGSGSTRNAFTVVNGVAYFSANDGSDGQELWRSDGTADGTTLVEDIAPGAASSSPQYLTNVDGALYFVANDGSGSNELLMTDGTAAGTSVVQTFTPGQTQSSSPTILGVLNNELYFSANDGVDGTQLWQTDGTAAGTTMVTDLSQNNSAYTEGNFSSLVSLNDAVFFEVGSSAGLASTIYRSDGTPGGTSAIFTPDSSAESVSALTVSGNSLYFLTMESSGPETAIDLWKSDGTTSGTALIASIPNSYPSGSGLGTLMAVNGKVFFGIQTDPTATGGSQYQLWSSDGTAAGTTEVTALSEPRRKPWRSATTWSSPSPTQRSSASRSGSPMARPAAPCSSMTFR